MAGETIADLFGLAIAVEHRAKAFYQKLAAMFSHHAEVVDFWLSYAEEETIHAQALETLRDSLTPEQMRLPADQGMVDTAYRILTGSLNDTVKHIHNLEDAFQVAHEMESVEVNSIFEFLMSYFLHRQDAQTFVRTQMTSHVGRLTTGMPLSLAYPELRRAIKVSE